MKNGDPSMFVYLLIDNGLLHEASASYTETYSRSRPTWLAPIYTERALSVSPFLVDIEGAYEAGDLDQVMIYVNALRPALHVSIIESELDLEQIAQHLRRFIFILGPEGKQFTFRYADCAVLALLPDVLTKAQWARIAGPIKRWQLHDRSGAVAELPSTGSIDDEPTPLCLESDQLAALDEASEPDHYLAKVKSIRNNETLPGNALEHYSWSKAARQIWQKSGNSTSLILFLLTDAALMTRGRILLSAKLENFLLTNNLHEFRENLQEHVRWIND